MEPNYGKTIYACFVGYIVQAIVNNFAPLLFLMFHKSYGIPLEKITLLVTFNFGLQLMIDLCAIGFVDRIGYRFSVILAHIMAAAGLIFLTILPEIFADSFVGLLISVIVYALGGGLLEVLLSPMVEACPTDNKETAMSLLHSFYCWGHVGVVLLSTLFFAAAGMRNWKILALVWAAVPVCNLLAFTRAPIAPLVEEGEQGLTMKELFSLKIFWVMMILMVCAGASEQGVSQWASAMAEQGLGINKTVGDLAGPMTFALFMGGARVFYGKKGESVPLQKFMLGSSIVCVISYLVIALVPVPVLGLAGCGLCGLSVGIMWPGTFSMASGAIRRGGTAMFALLALAGDVGCSAGPTLAGYFAGRFEGKLRIGILIAVVFPALMTAFQVLLRKSAAE